MGEKKAVLRCGILYRQCTGCCASPVDQDGDRFFRRRCRPRQFELVVERLADGGDASSHRSSVFLAHALWDLGQVAIFDHGEFCISTIFKLLLDRTGSASHPET